MGDNNPNLSSSKGEAEIGEHELNEDEYFDPTSNGDASNPERSKTVTVEDSKANTSGTA